jgi:hypothetical protein
VAETARIAAFKASWTAEEIMIFEEEEKLEPKNFEKIASKIKTKSTAECVSYYYHREKVPLPSKGKQKPKKNKGQLYLKP